MSVSKKTMDFSLKIKVAMQYKSHVFENSRETDMWKVMEQMSDLLKQKMYELSMKQTISHDLLYMPLFKAYFKTNTLCNI